MSEDETEGNTQEMGIEFGDLYNDLENEEYPIAIDELIDRYGDRELTLANGSATLEGVLSEYPDEDQSFEEPEEARQAVLNMVGSEAVGRQRYSDRGEDTDEETTNESF